MSSSITVFTRVSDECDTARDDEDRDRRYEKVAKFRRQSRSQSYRNGVGEIEGVFALPSRGETRIRLPIN